MKLPLFLLFLILSSLHLCAQTTVIDAESDSPLGGVLVFANDGSYIGMTDSLGILPKESARLDTIILQDVAHESVKSALPAESIRMTPMNYNMEEVEVKQKADYIKLRGFYREYEVCNGLMFRYEDGMADYYIPINGGRVKTNYLMSRQGTPGWTPLCLDDFFRELDGTDMKANTLMQYIRHQQKLSPPDTLSYIKTDSINGTIKAYRDQLGNDKNHTFTINLLLFKARLTEADDIGVYNLNSRHESQFNLISFCSHEKYWLKSSWLKFIRKLAGNAKFNQKEIDVDEFSEFYVVERSVVSKEQMKEERKDKEENVECIIPDFVPSLNDVLLDKLQELKEATKSQWEGKVIIVPTRTNK